MSTYDAILIQDDPRIVATRMQGRRLLEMVVPSWRIKDRRLGWQRLVRDERCREIAAKVLDKGRTFPNAIVIATDSATKSVRLNDGKLTVPAETSFIVIDGQHRLYAQQYSKVDTAYACMLHVGLTTEQMAELFVEINNNQKRIPPSLKWDLFRLTQPETERYSIQASELVYELTVDKSSPLFQRIDLTGEEPGIVLKNASLAPEIKSLVAREPLKEAAPSQFHTLVQYFSAIRAVDPDGWRRGDGPLYKARVLRALLQLMPAIMEKQSVTPRDVTAADFRKSLQKIDLDTLEREKIQALQGTAGIVAIRTVIASQLGILEA